MNQQVDCRKDAVIVLPSLDPDIKFHKVVEELIESGFQHIVIVNDGSDEAHSHWFEEAALHKQCVILDHGVNKGKGRALKTAFSYVSENFPDAQGVVTIDGDGQHLLQDILACARKMLENNDCVVLGCRDFNQPGIPPRSVAGNKTTSRFFRLLFGIKLSDTQTGLRAIPAKYLPDFCRIEGERFEYETNMLLNMKRMGIPFLEQPIATVYDPDDYSSHYDAVKDSLRIVRIMLKFLTTDSSFRYIVSAVLSWCVDNGLYILLFELFGMLIAPAAAASSLSQLIARALSSVFNFEMNFRYVFRSMESIGKAARRYYCLCIPQTFVSIVCLTALVTLLKIGSPGLAALVKIVLELLLFVISYYIQKKWVFKKKETEKTEAL